MIAVEDDVLDGCHRTPFRNGVVERGEPSLME
jgi:hypothetical protein